MLLPTRLPWWLKLTNPVFTALIRLGVPIGTQRILSVPGRESGKLYSTPVTLLSVDGRRYIVSFPWTGWVRNARASGSGTLARGRSEERVALRDVDGQERVRVVREFPVQAPRGVRFFQLPADPDAFEAAADLLAVIRVDPAPPE